MPKERISTDPNANVVELRWGTGPGVQIATSCPSRLVSATIPVDLSRHIDANRAEATEETHPFDGWYADLDRAGINRLIKALRRARDQAFGRDE